MYERTREFLSCHVAGFGHWYGLEVADKLRVGKKLRLEPEPDNPYDSDAVAIWCGSSKIGYIPHYKNAVLAQLLHFGYGSAFEARVQSVDWSRHPEAQVRIIVFLKDAR